MQHLKKSVYAVLIVFLLAIVPAATFAQDALGPCFAEEEGMRVRYEIGDTRTTESGRTFECLGDNEWSEVASPVIAMFDLVEDLEELSFTRNGRSFVNQPVDMLAFDFPVQGEVADGILTFEIDDVVYTIVIEDQLTEIEVAESAATFSPQATEIVNEDGEVICESTQVTFNEMYRRDGTLSDPNRIDLSFGQDQPWHLDYYFAPGEEPFSLYGIGLDRRVVLLGYGSLWTWTGDCADLDLVADVSEYRRVRGGGDQDSFIILNSGLGWDITSFLSAEQPEVNVLNRTSTEIPPFRILEIGNQPIPVDGQPEFSFTAESVGTVCTATGPDQDFNIRSGRGTGFTREATLSARTVITVTDLQDGWYSVISPVQGYVSADIISLIGNCGQTTSAPAVVAPAVQSTTSGTSCQPATRGANADGRTVEGPVVIEAWEPVSGNVVVPAGVSVTGYKGAVWGYSSQQCAEADLRSSGKTFTVYGQ